MINHSKFLVTVRCFVAAFSLGLAAPSAFADDPNPNEWAAVLEEAKGQTVYWNAWGGEETINDYIAWVGAEVLARYDVTLVHVKLTDTAEAVSRVLAEKQAGRNSGGAVDLIWINGENFASMKASGLLLKEGWSDKTPQYRFVDFENKAVLTKDFLVPVDGLESPWGTAQLSFYYDSAQIDTPPTTLDALADWVAENPGRFTYAAPPNFIGTTFIKQLAYGLVADTSALSNPVDQVDFDAVTAPIWNWLDRVHPDMWRSARVFAKDTAQLKTLLADNEISIAMTFNPGEASSGIASGLLPESVRSFVLDYGSLGNAHFVTIPFNATAKAGAMTVANFLLSPEAQAMKQDEGVWGDPTVLAYEKLDADGQGFFDALSNGPATLTPAELGKSLSELDPSWTVKLEAEWAKRYSAGG